jgi:hypothetical protein
MPLAESGSRDFHVLLVEWLGLVVSPHVPVELGEGVETGRKGWVLLAESDSPDLHRLLVEWFGLGVLSLRPEEVSRLKCQVGYRGDLNAKNLSLRRSGNGVGDQTPAQIPVFEFARWKGLVHHIDGSLRPYTTPGIA